MALDGLCLHQIHAGIHQMLPAKINKIQQVSDTEILFNLRSRSSGFRLMISCHSQFNRINITEENYVAPDIPNNFIMILRKYLDGGIISESKQLGLDRILQFKIQARNDLGDVHDYYLYVELMGKYANMILVDENNKIIDAMKRIPPFENNSRTIHSGASFTLPKPHEGKKDPFIDTSFNPENSLTAQFHGFSPLLSKEVLYRVNQGEKFESIMQQIQESDRLYLVETDKDTVFHVIPLTHIEGKRSDYPLMKGMDVIFYHREERERIRQQSGDLFKIVRRELQRNRQKYPKLLHTLEEANNCEHFRRYGDLLYAYGNQIKEKLNQVTFDDFETNQPVTIPLDIRFDLKQNAKKYYQKYHKAKNAQIIVSEQIESCEREIEYFECIEAQLEYASFYDALEIRNELEKKGLLKPQKQRIKKRSKEEIPHFITLRLEDDIQIYVGKNNIQNDYLTFRFAKKNDTWFHAKDLHGAHVIINSNQLDERLIRMCASLAAYYSKGKHSSSVPVNYCEIRMLKKAKKAALGQALLSTYKTIYIDPEEKDILTWIDTYQVKKR